MKATRVIEQDAGEGLQLDELEHSALFARSVLRHLPGSAVVLLDRDLCLRMAEGPALEEVG